MTKPLTIAAARAYLESRGFTVHAPSLQIVDVSGMVSILSNNHVGTWRGFDFRERDLSYADFRNLDLTGALFTNANLEHADFRKANVSYISFRHCKLAGADFRGAILDHTTFNYSPRHLAIFDKEKP